MTKDEFIEKANKKHNGKYDYSLIPEKFLTKQKITIICPKHGEFMQKACEHLRGCGCKQCGIETRAKKQTLTTEIFIEKARLIHNDKYDYHKVEYKNSQTKVCITCHAHGDFWQMPNSHLQGAGCPKCKGMTCSKKRRMSTETFIEKATNVHNGKYDSSLVNYVNERTKVCIICPEHGEFWQTPKNHLKGQGCPECGKRCAKEWRQNDFMSFIEESTKRFGDIYQFPYIKDEYKNSHSKITIKCKKCGSIFVKIACDHLTSPFGGCACYSFKSKAEDELHEELQKYIFNEEIRLRDRTVLKGRELDIYIPSKKIAIEYDGVFWHSETYGGKGKYYHLDKSLECAKNGIRLIHIFEDEYINHKEIVLSKLKHIFNADNEKKKIYGRNCIIHEIDKNKCKEFLNKNHIQGYFQSTVYIGAFNKNNLIGVMSLKKTKNEWELTRFATDINFICCGVGGKIFKYFTKKYNPSKIKSFADRRWSIDASYNLYRKLGFVLEKYTLPDYRYVKPKVVKRFHKFGFRKKILHKKYGLPLTMTESEMTKKLGYDRIWDCGLIKYVWENTKNKQENIFIK